MAEEKKKKSWLQEFQEFIARGNVMDMAVGVIVGGSFTTVVNSLVEDIINPLISALTGGSTEVPGMTLVVNGNSVNFGTFLGTIINFLITAFAVFLMVKGLNALNDAKDAAMKKAGLEKEKEEEAVPEPRKCPYCKQEIPDDATRCPHCTAKLEGYENPLE